MIQKAKRIFTYIAFVTALAATLAPAARADNAPSPTPPAPAPVAPTPAPAQPGTGTTTPAPPAAQPVAVIPFLYERDKIVIDATINGQGPFQFGVDSGSETMIVTDAVAKQCKLPVSHFGADISGTTGGGVDVGMVILTHLGVGSATIEHPVCTLAHGPIAYDGYIGEPIFDSYVVQIDFGRHMLSLYKKGTYTPDPADIAMPILFGARRIPVVKGSIAGIAATFEVDSGSAFGVEILPDTVNANDLRDKFQKVGTVMSSSAGGERIEDVYNLKDLNFGDGNPLNVAGDCQAILLNSAGPADNFQARIGAPTLSQAISTFDYDSGKLYVRPIPPPAGISL